MTRESPWGLLALADAHLHFFSRRFFAGLAAQKQGLTPEDATAQLGWTMPPEQPEKLAELWAQELDRNGVDRSVLIGSAPGEEDPVGAAVRAYPDRFFAFAMVNPRAWNPETFSEVHVACLFPAMHCF